MPRRRVPTTVRDKVLSVLHRARSTGFNNVSAALAEAVALMPKDDMQTGHRGRE